MKYYIKGKNRKTGHTYYAMEVYMTDNQVLVFTMSPNPDEAESHTKLEVEMALRIIRDSKLIDKKKYIFYTLSEAELVKELEARLKILYMELAQELAQDEKRNR